MRHKPLGTAGLGCPGEPARRGLACGATTAARSCGASLRRAGGTPAPRRWWKLFMRWC